MTPPIHVGMQLRDKPSGNIFVVKDVTDDNVVLECWPMRRYLPWDALQRQIALGIYTVVTDGRDRKRLTPRNG